MDFSRSYRSTVVVVWTLDMQRVRQCVITWSDIRNPDSSRCCRDGVMTDGVVVPHAWYEISHIIWLAMSQWLQTHESWAMTKRPMGHGGMDYGNAAASMPHQAMDHRPWLSLRVAINVRLQVTTHMTWHTVCLRKIWDQMPKRNNCLDSLIEVGLTWTKFCNGLR